jgi:hypothetical protein
MSEPTIFNYDNIEPRKRERLEQCATTIRNNHKTATDLMVDVGRQLNIVKDLLGHGSFLPWLALEFPNISAKSANRYMDVAREFGDKSDILSVLDRTGLYLLAAKSTPPCVRTAIVARLKEGDVITTDEVRAAVREAQQPVRAPSNSGRIRLRSASNHGSASSAGTVVTVPFQEEPQRLDNLPLSGDRFDANAGSVTDNPNSPIEKVTRELVESVVPHVYNIREKLASELPKVDPVKFVSQLHGAVLTSV